MADTSQDKTEKDTQAYAALGVAFVCIVVGLPLWWKTTEVYRVSLPNGDIQQLADVPIIYQVDFTVVIFEESWDKVQLAYLGEDLKAKLESVRGASYLLFSSYQLSIRGKVTSLEHGSSFNCTEENLDLNIRYRGNIRHAYKEEKDVLQAAGSMAALDEMMTEGRADGQHGGKYFLVVLPKSSELDPGNGLIGTRRSAYIKPDGLDALLPLVQHVIKDLIVDEVAMMRIYHTAMASKTLQPDKESMRGLRYHPGYDVTFTLLNPQPDVLDVQWDIANAVNTYLQPFLKVMADYCTITVKSQYLYYTSLSVRPKKSTVGDYFILSQDDLPHIINPIEAHLNSHVSTNPNLNFVVYVPTRDQSPLHIHDDSGNQAAVDAFLSPRWGGMMIHNVWGPAPNESLPAPAALDMRSVMEVFISQLRLLLGITKTASILGVEVSQPGNAAVCQWEMDKWLRSRTVENVATATATLKSLTQLLNEVSNIVINDDIGNEVQRAVTNIEQCHRFLKLGKLREAFATSRQAIISSEKAFFDPSLLELLYFPEDQKFAIYIPLFLPISIPVLLSLMQSVKWFKARRAAAKAEKADQEPATD